MGGMDMGVLSIWNLFSCREDLGNLAGNADVVFSFSDCAEPRKHREPAVVAGHRTALGDHRPHQCSRAWGDAVPARLGCLAPALKASRLGLAHDTLCMRNRGCLPSMDHSKL